MGKKGLLKGLLLGMSSFVLLGGVSNVDAQSVSSKKDVVGYSTFLMGNTEVKVKKLGSHKVEPLSDGVRYVAKNTSSGVSKGLEEGINQATKVLAEEAERKAAEAHQNLVNSYDFVFGDYGTNVTWTSAMSGYGTTDTLWQWDQIPNYYLAEYVSPMGYAARQMTVGSVVYLYGKKYVADHVEYSIWNGEGAFDLAYNLTAASSFSIQTCEYNTYDTTLRIITFVPAE